MLHDTLELLCQDGRRRFALHPHSGKPDEAPRVIALDGNRLSRQD